MEDPKHNLSDYEFFFFYIKHENWFPMQNHGLYTNIINNDWPHQINAYLNLFKGINYKCLLLRKLRLIKMNLYALSEILARNLFIFMTSNTLSHANYPMNQSVKSKPTSH